MACQIQPKQIADGPGSGLDADTVDGIEGGAFILEDGTNPFTGNQSMGGNRLTSVGAPVAGDDAARKSDVDAVAAGLSWKDSVRVATTANGDLATAYENGDTIDGIVLATGDRILLKDQTDPIENGIYTVNATGAPTRATDADEVNELDGGAVFVEEGTANADKAFVQTADGVTPGTDAQTWVQFGGVSSLSGSTPTTINAGDTGTAGVSSAAARGDHEHPVSTGTPTATIEAGDTAAEGSATSLARSDHQHAVSTAAPAASVDAGDSAAEGTATSLARSDHQHAVSTGVAGTIQPDDAAAEGTATTLARSDHKHAIAAAAAGQINGGDVAAEGASTSFARADHTHGFPSLVQEAVTTEAVVGTDTALADTLNNTPATGFAVMLFLNGQYMPQGAGLAYTLAGSTITWLASSGCAPDLAPTDEIYVLYWHN